MKHMKLWRVKYQKGYRVSECSQPVARYHKSMKEVIILLARSEKIT